MTTGIEELVAYTTWIFFILANLLRCTMHDCLQKSDTADAVLLGINFVSLWYAILLCVGRKRHAQKKIQQIHAVLSREYYFDESRHAMSNAQRAV